MLEICEHSILLPAGVIAKQDDRLTNNDLISPVAGDVWYAGSVMGGIMLYGLAVFLFVFSAVPWWFNVSKHLHDILGRTHIFRVLIDE
jgi:hypothetical protein